MKEMVPTDIKTRVIMLILTHSCNLDCIYCYEHYKMNSHTSMNSDMAKRLVENEIQNLDKAYDRLVIHFMGGEPLLNFDVIRSVSEWIESRDWPIDISLTATTNGTLIATHKDWLWKHRKIFKLVLSADGNEQMQDTNRPNSFLLIDYDFFTSTWPDGKVKMTISPFTVNRVADGIKYLHEKGVKRIDANLALGPSIEWTINHIKIYRQELRQLISFYLANPDYIPASMLNTDISRILLLDDWRKRCFCGEHLVCYDSDGRAYPCHLFSPVALDAVQLTRFQHDCIDFEDKQLFASEKCSRCAIRRCCPRCPGMNYQYTKSLDLAPLFFCYMSQIEFLSTCTLLNSRLRLHQDIPNEKLIIKALDKIKRIITN